MINEDIVDLRQKYKRNPNVKLPTKNVMPKNVPENAVMAIVKNGVVVESDTYKSAELIIIPNGARHIGEEVFLDCESLTSVIIPDSVTSIGNWAFRSCESLTSITIPDSVTSIGHGAFEYCENLTSVNIPNSVTNIESDAFAWCTNLTSITIPDGVTSIGDRAFKECENLTSINIPKGVIKIGESAFSFCRNLKSANINAKEIGKQAFLNCESLTSVIISDSVTSIGEAAFYCCQCLQAVTIPNSVTDIGRDAFVWCEDLDSVNIPKRFSGNAAILKNIFGDDYTTKKITFTESLNEEIVDLRQKYKRNPNIKLSPAQQKASEPASKSFNINDYWRDYTYGDKGGFPWVTQSLKSPKMLVDRLNGIEIYSVASLAALDYWIKTRWNSLETLYKVSPSELAFTRAVLEALIEISDSDPILGILKNEDMAIAARYVAAVVSFFIEECQPKLKEAIRVL